MVEIKSVRGSSVDLERLWSLPITTVIDGKNVESFCLDATGLLVYRSGDRGVPQSLIPYAVDAWELNYTLLSLFKENIERKFRSPLVPRQYTGLYQETFFRFPHLYAAAAELHADKALLESAIEIYQDSDKETQIEIEYQLADVGLYPFFSICNLSPEYFESSQALVKRIGHAGWVSQCMVLKKATLL